MDKHRKKQQPNGEDWPGNIRDRLELDAALKAGERSGVSPLTGEEIVERALANLRPS